MICNPLPGNSIYSQQGFHCTESATWMIWIGFPNLLTRAGFCYKEPIEALLST